MDLDPRLHPYQRRAVEHLHGLDGEQGAGLFMDMGLGKTATVLQALTPEHLPALVLAPLRVAQTVWEAEAATWRPDLRVRDLSKVGQTKQYPNQALRRGDLLRDPAGWDVSVVTRDQVSCLGERRHPFRTVVLDELSGYKNYSTGRHRDTRRVTRNRVEHVWGLTGTPAPNGYMDLWGQVYMLDGGDRLGATLGAYRNRYFDPLRRHKVTGIVIEWGLKPGAKDAINALLADLCLSMKKEDYLDLPPITFNEVKVPLPKGVLKKAAALRKDLVVDLDIIGTVSTPTSAALSGRLRQLSAGFLYADGDTSTWERLHDEKTRALREIIDGTGDNVLVFTQFTAERLHILDKIDGAVDISERDAVKRWSRGEVPVLVAHPRSAGHGLNLQHGGHTAVYTSVPWSLEEWEQSRDRLHRQGQPGEVVIHALLSPGTPDQRIWRSLSGKGDVQDGLMDYLRDPEVWL